MNLLWHGCLKILPQHAPTITAKWGWTVEPYGTESSKICYFTCNNAVRRSSLMTVSSKVDWASSLVHCVGSKVEGIPRYRIGGHQKCWELPRTRTNHLSLSLSLSAVFSIGSSSGRRLLPVWNAAAPAECNGQLTTQPSMTKPLDGELQTRMSPVFHVPQGSALWRHKLSKMHPSGPIQTHLAPSGPILSLLKEDRLPVHLPCAAMSLTDKELCQAPMAKPGWLAGQVSISPTPKKNSLKESVSKESKDSRHLWSASMFFCFSWLCFFWFSSRRAATSACCDASSCRSRLSCCSLDAVVDIRRLDLSHLKSH